MDFRELTYITTIADCGSVTEAAKRLYISQPSLSYILGKVEEDLGVKLFDRKTNESESAYTGDYLYYEIVLGLEATGKQLASVAMALAQIAGVSEENIRKGMETFAGVDRRFDFHVRRDDMVYLSDYAHHPEEIRKSLSSINQLYEGRHVKVIFQPHLYTRTRDFYKEFADALSLVKDIVLVDIYPARELPIEGVTSALIAENLQSDVKYELCRKEDVLDIVRRKDFDVLVTLGAGDLDNYADDITAILNA